MGEGFVSPAPAESADLTGCTLGDESLVQKWRTWTDPGDVPLGKARSLVDGRLAFSVSPGEWVVVGAGDPPEDAVDLTHVRAMFRLTGPGARDVLAYVCALDLGDEMTPDGGAARTLVAGTATELVRNDQAGALSYLLLVSRSFGGHVWERLVECA